MKLEICRGGRLLAAIAAVWLIGTVELAAESYVQQWRVDDYFGRRDITRGVVVDDSGGIYVGGYTEAKYTLPDSQVDSSLVARYDTNGSRAWLTLTYATSGLEHVGGMAIDGENNLFIGGQTYRHDAGAEAFLAKVDSAGNNLWERHLGSLDNEFGFDVDVDSDGNSYLVGSTTGDLGVGSNANGYDGFIAKYSPGGESLWTRQLADSVGDIVETVAVDSADQLVVAGSKADGPFIARYDSQGNLLWNLRPEYSSTAGAHTSIIDSAADADGNFFVVGAVNQPLAASTASTLDAILAKHDANGNLLWLRSFSTRGTEQFSAVSVDSLGNVYVAGETTRRLDDMNASDVDSVWATYDAAGNLRWFEQFGTSELDGAWGITAGPAGDVFVVGNVVRNVGDYVAGDFDMYLIRFALVPEPSSGMLILLAVGAMAVGAMAGGRSFQCRIAS